MKVIGENEVRIQLKASTGPMGPAGPKGDKGDKGDTGPRGATGATGATGPAGPKGERGEKGERGATGATGPQGEKGEKGEKGDAFTYGDFTAEQLEALRGPQGEKGDTGATGPQGPQGEKGDKGDKGDPGATGPQGEVGPQGPAGSIDNLPIASATQLGGVKPVAKTGEMTQSVGVDEAGGLWTAPGSGGGAAYTEMELCNFTSTEEAATINVELSSDAKNFLKTCDEIYLTLIPGIPSSATERANAKIVLFGNYTNSITFLDTTSGVLPTSEQSSAGRDIVNQRIDCVIRVYGRKSYYGVDGTMYLGCCNCFNLVHYPTNNGNHVLTPGTTKMEIYHNMPIKDLATGKAQYIKATSTNGVFGVGTEIIAWARRYNA